MPRRCPSSAPAATLGCLLALVGCGGGESGASDAAPDDARPPIDAPAAAPGFLAPELLARPTDRAISVSLLPSGPIEAYVEVLPAAGPAITTAPVTHAGDGPLTIDVDGLGADEVYRYAVRWRAPGGGDYLRGTERSFRTARPRGRAFTFTVQADAHLDERSSLPLYQRALDNQLADRPDFMIDLGDTFMCEKHATPLVADPPAMDEATVVARYRYERGNFGRVAHSVPLFLVDGNHEGEVGWLRDGDADNLALWAARARVGHFPPPRDGAFYRADVTDEPFVGRRTSWYAWTWGDALFVVLDPFWHTTRRANQDPWAWTLGEAQYRWLAATLAASDARFRFVFIHHLVGGLDGQARGGVEAAPFFEWGGRELDGTPAFATRRPGWPLPIHDLLVAHHVTAVFHGHDHLYAHQTLDGIAYQEVPQPSAPNFNSGPNLAAEYHYASGTIAGPAGHLRVTVEPTGARVEYVRAYRPEDEIAGRHNRDVSDDYLLTPR